MPVMVPARDHSRHWAFSGLSIGEFGRLYLDGKQLEAAFRRVGRQSDLWSLVDQVLGSNANLLAVRFGHTRPNLERARAREFLQALTNLFTVAFELDREGAPPKIERAMIRRDAPFANTLAHDIQQCVESSWPDFVANHPKAAVLREHGPRIFARRNARRIAEKPAALATEILAALYDVNVKTVQNAMKPKRKKLRR